MTTQNSHTETLFNEDGSLQVSKVKALSRTYARAIAGQPTAMSFNTDSSSFALTYTAGVATAECSDSYLTEIYLHETFYYPQGYTVAITDGTTGEALPATSWYVLESGNTTVGDFSVLAVTVDQSGTQVVVTIEAN